MSLTYPHLESLGLVEAVGSGEDVELVQNGAPTEPIVFLVDEKSLQQEQLRLQMALQGSPRRGV